MKKKLYIPPISSILIMTLMVIISTASGFPSTLGEIGDSPSHVPLSQGSSLYTYHTSYPGTTGNYAGLVADMMALNATYPQIYELYTAQEAYGLPNVTQSSEVYKTWIIRITNESTGFNKPEVLFIGGHHGDEKVGVETAYYYGEWLVENYGTDPYTTYLVDHREIYLIPLANPYGWVHHQRSDEHGYDMNRDYPYDPSNHIFGTIGARAIHELTKRHLFINTLSWHGGAELICYAWGSYAHYGGSSGSPLHECPDDIAFYKQGQYMSQFGGPYSGYYPWMRANDWYPVYGAYEDYAYAASWDTSNNHPSWLTQGCRSLTHCVEMSSTKYPSQSTLGGSADIYTPGGNGDGYVPKNMRIALLLTDLAQPYITFTSPPPVQADPGETITVSWRVMGALNTTSTNILYGTNPDPIHNSTGATSNQTGGTGWQNVTYTQNLIMPITPGEYYFVVRATVDQDTLTQGTPNPDIQPQSLYVQMRTNNSWTITLNENTLTGHTNWYSPVIPIAVGSSSPPEISHVAATPILGGDLVNITCRVTDASGVESVKVNIMDPVGGGVNVSMAPLGGGWYYYVGSFLLLGGYDFFVWAEDLAGNSNTSGGMVVMRQGFSGGWNLVTVSVVSGWTAESLGDNISGCTVVLMFNASTQTFVTHVVGTPWDDFPITNGVGYYLYVTGDTVLTYSGGYIPSVNVHLFPGWNTIGWCNRDESTAESLGDNITGCSMVLMFDAPTQMFLTHVVNTPWDNFGVTRSMGLFIYTVSESWWSGDG